MARRDMEGAACGSRGQVRGSLFGTRREKRRARNKSWSSVGQAVTASTRNMFKNDVKQSLAH